MPRNPYYQDAYCTLYHGDCREVMPQLEGVTAIVSDPPYGLSFMGNTISWDHGVPGEEFWRIAAAACLPGAPMLAFGGTRTYHRLVCAIEDAGWEVRDCLQWLYGSGFPKSHNIGKALDKHGGQSVGWFGPWFRKWRKEHGVTQKEVAALFPSKTGGLTGCVANWELGLNMPTCEQFNAIKDAFGLPFASLSEAEREVVGAGTSGTTAIWADDGMGNFDITAPATPAARLWDGWGTALKPAHEPICLAMNPLDGTFAHNALEHGVAGLNVDGGRIPCGPIRTTQGQSAAQQSGSMYSGKDQRNRRAFVNTQGRWPANIIHDGSEEVLAGFPESKDGVAVGGRGNAKSIYGSKLNKGVAENQGYGGKGSAARFFYCAKASKAERNRGCEGLDDTIVHEDKWCTKDRRSGEPRNPRPHDARPTKNSHPTVKPLALMRYLCTLVTMPERNLILDPFAGSGTTGVACKELGLPCVLIEQDEHHCEIIAARLAAASVDAPPPPSPDRQEVLAL